MYSVFKLFNSVEIWPNGIPLIKLITKKDNNENKKPDDNVNAVYVSILENLLLIVLKIEIDYWVAL